MWPSSIFNFQLSIFHSVTSELSSTISTMKVVLATGIYPPEIGGPATYVANLARELTKERHEVIVITYSANETRNQKQETRNNLSEIWPIIHIPRTGGPFIRWLRYARQLRKFGKDADVIYAFSSMSAGMPIALARGIGKPKKILRLGGDFLWERYTDRGGLMSLRRWYESNPRLSLVVSRFLLRQFDHIVFSTDFQKEIYEEHYKKLPPQCVIENAIPLGSGSGSGPTRISEPGPGPDSEATVPRIKHNPLRLLFMGRFVGFKNLPALLRAMVKMPSVTLTFVGSGPMEKHLKALTKQFLLENRVSFRDIAHDKDKQEVFAEHDLLIIPSTTEISPNVALEAMSSGLPVLLSEETGLSEVLRSGMITAPLIEPNDIVRAVADISTRYEEVTRNLSRDISPRGWTDVAEEHVRLFEDILN